MSEKSNKRFPKPSTVPKNSTDVYVPKNKPGGSQKVRTDVDQDKVNGDPRKVGNKPTDQAQVDPNKTSSSVFHLIVTAPSQTGDVYHVAAAVALDKYTDVMVLGPEGDLEVLGDKTLPDSDPLIKYYEQAAAASSDVAQSTRNRVHNIGYIKPKLINDGLIKFNDDEPKSVDWIIDPTSTDSKTRQETLKALKSANVTSGEYDLESFREYLEDKEKKWKYFGITLSKTTWKISDCFESRKNPRLADIYTGIANALGSKTLRSTNIIFGVKDQVYLGPLHTKGLPSLSEKDPVLLLWSRYSGSSKVGGGYTPEGDSDLIGQKQLIQIATDLKFRIITIGHEPKWELVQNLNAARSSTAHLGEFYEVAPITKDRATQISFFLALMEQYPGMLYQMGQKTGGMDGAALVGIPTVYIECHSRNEQARMFKWVDKVPFYQDANILQPPSILGKAIFSLNKEIIGGTPEEKEKMNIHDFKNKIKSSPFWSTLGQPKEIRFSIIALLRYIWTSTEAINADLKNQGEKLNEVLKKMTIYEDLKNLLKGNWGEKLKELKSGDQENIKGVVNLFPSIKLGAIWIECITCLNHLDHTVFDNEKPLRGYSKADLDKIKIQLTDMLHTKYKDDEDIVRNKEGKYVPRKDLKVQH